MKYILDDIQQYINEENVEAIEFLIKENDLEIKDGKLIAKDLKYAKGQEEFWDQRQLALKINLNALYGSILNSHSRFYDQRIGQSVTLTGRSIAKHMNSKINEVITGVYDHKGDAIIYSDTDSEIGSTLHHTSAGLMTVEELFDLCAIKWMNGNNEYSTDERIKVLTFDPQQDFGVYKNFNYIYRHKVSKPKWKITDQFDNEIIITGDHSIMIERDNILMEIKPKDMLEDDTLISIKIE